MPPEQPIDPHVHGKDPAACPGADGSYPLVCHLLDTAVVMEHLWHTRVRAELATRVTEILRGSGYEGSPATLLMLIAALHDVGKANPWFQYQERGDHDFATALADSTRLPRTPASVRSVLRSTPDHPLRRHEFLSHRVVSGTWPQNTDLVRGPRWLAMVLGGHHGYWRSPGAETPVSGLGDLLTAGWTGQQQAHVHVVEQALGLRVEDVPKLPSTAEAALVFLCSSGLLTLSDWIASDDVQVQAGKELWESTHANRPIDGARAREWMDLRRDGLRTHVDGALGPVGTYTTLQFRDAVLNGFEPRPLQREALSFTESTDPGLWVCMYPTGDGKTEAALLRGAARPTDPLFFGLPTTATTDAMEARLTALGTRLPSGGFPLVKAHQYADMLRPAVQPSGVDCRDDDARYWYSSSIRKVVAPNVVGTVDQALAGALAQRHLTLRLFGLANHHVVLDEVHTFDAYQTELLIELLHWWGLTGTRVTLLSATLPTSHVTLMARAYQAGVLGTPVDKTHLEVPVTFPSTLSVSRTGRITLQEPVASIRTPPATLFEVRYARTSQARTEAHVEWARATAREHPHSPIAIVTNVVDDCIALALRLTEDPEVTRTHEVLCLHSRMVSGHRTAVEERLRQRGGTAAHRAGFDTEKPLLLVGTQVIQASLDYDVDFLASDLAPAPDLIQRLGRAWRFEGSLAGTPFRGGRLPTDSQRRFRVVAVTDDAGALLPHATRPYLTAPMQRTFRAMLDFVDTGEPVDLVAASQQWVDRAYDAPPEDLLDEDVAPAVVAEAVATQQRSDAADLSRVALATRSARGSGTPLLLMGPRGKSAAWKDLVEATSQADDPDLMRTRYVEQDTVRVVLFDSGGTAHFRNPHRPASATALPGGSDTVEFLPSGISDAHNYMSSVLTLSHGLVLAAVAKHPTSDPLPWEPPNRMLRRFQPLDLQHLEGWTYHPVVGLMKGAS